MIDEKRGQAFQPGQGMAIRLTTAGSTGAMRRSCIFATLAAMAAVTALTTGAAARPARPAAPVEKTRIGMRVIISPLDAEPVEFSHPSLFVPKAEAIAAALAKAEAAPREAAEAAKVLDEAKKAAATATRETATLAASLRKLEGL